MLAAWTVGVNRSRTARISRCLAEHARRGTGTHMASGQSRNAREIGMADRTPNLPGLVRSGADHAAAAGRPADDEQRRLSGTFRVDHARDGDEERVGVDEQDLPGGWAGSSHERKIRIASDTRRLAESTTPSVDYA